MVEDQHEGCTEEHPGVSNRNQVIGLRVDLDGAKPL